jgi:hypothetical protein
MWDRSGTGPRTGLDSINFHLVSKPLGLISARHRRSAETGGLGLNSWTLENRGGPHYVGSYRATRSA